MDCRTSRSLLDLARPESAELQPSEADALAAHLNRCPECDALFRQERQVDAHLGRAVRDVPVPQGLRDRLLDRLASERRKWLGRVVLRGAGLASAAAAVLLVGLWGASHWLGPRPQPVDLDQLQTRILDQQLRADNGPEAVAEWFRDAHHVEMTAPSDVGGGRALNYNLLASSHLEPFQGQQVPLLVFDKGGLRLQVYVLSARQFDIKGLGNSQRWPPPSRGWRMEVIANEGEPFAYVLVFTENPDGLKPFLLGGGAG